MGRFAGPAHLLPRLVNQPLRIRLADPRFRDSDIAAVERVLRSGQLVQADVVAQFEADLGAVVGSRHAVAVSSGTAALHLALLALGIGPGDLVAIPGYTFVATANAVSLTGADVLVVDVEPGTYNLDPVELRRRIQELGADDRDRLRAIMPVHQFGLPADMTRIQAVAEEYGVTVLEDAACAIGSTWLGRPAGSLGRLGCFSFHPRKVLTTGEGGAVVTDDADVAERLRNVRAHAPSIAPAGRIAFGMNYRLTEMQAALGIGQIGDLGPILDLRQSLGREYLAGLSEISGLGLPVVPEAAQTNWQSFVVVLGAGIERGKILAGLAARGIESRAPATAIHRVAPYEELIAGQASRLPQASLLHDQAMALPLHQGMSASDVRYVVESLRAVLPGS